MNIKDEFFPYLLEKGLLPKCHVNRFITFNYNESIFSIRPIKNIVRTEAECIMSMPLETEMFSIILYNANSYELPKDEREKMVNIAAIINLKYRGIKTIISVEDDFHAEIHLEFSNRHSIGLKCNLERYLDTMILANNEISELLHS